MRLYYLQRLAHDQKGQEEVGHEEEDELIEELEESVISLYEGLDVCLVDQERHA